MRLTPLLGGCFLYICLPVAVQAQSANTYPKKFVDSLQKENAYLKDLLKISIPIKEAESDDISFKVIRVAGNKAAQTITIDLLVTDQAADVQVFGTAVKSIIDAGGNEYPLSRFALGAQSGGPMFPIYTKLFKATPLKCSFTFSGTDGGSLLLKRFDFPYRSGRTNNYASTTGNVYFTDLPVTWK